MKYSKTDYDEWEYYENPEGRGKFVKKTRLLPSRTEGHGTYYEAMGDCSC